LDLVKKSLKFIIAALMISTKIASPAMALVTPSQLAQVQAFTNANDISGLRAFLEANPQILESNSPLSRALSEFMESTDSVFERLFPGDVVERLKQIANIPDIY
jgi:hypothetical protein